MYLGDITIQNFLSVVEASTNLANKGLVLVQGINNDSAAFESNGASKSTIFSEAITWALTGETIRGKKGDSVINRTEKKNTSVSLNIHDDNGDLYTVVRHRKHSQHGNHVLLFRNGTNITNKSDGDTTKDIEELIGMDFLTFTNSVMFGQGVSKLFASATDSEQKKILEQMLQIDIYRLCMEKTKEKIATKNAELSSYNADLKLFNADKATTDALILELQDKEDKLSAQVAERIERLNAEILICNSDISNLPSDKELADEIENARSLITKSEEKLETYATHEKSRADLMSIKSSSEREASRLQKLISDDTKKLADIRSGKNVPKNCDACGQKLPVNDTSHIEKHLEDAIELNKGLLKAEQEEAITMNSLIVKTDKLLEPKKKLEATIRQLRDAHTEAKNDMIHVTKHRKSLKEKVASLEEQIREQNEMLKVTYTDMIRENVDKVFDINLCIDVTQDKIDAVQAEIAKYEFWLNGFGNQGIKSVLLDSVTPFLNQRCAHYLAKLSDSTIQVTFNTQTTLKDGQKRDKFAVDVDNVHGDEDYRGNSGGEKRRIDIAINMALQDLVLSRASKRLDIIVYDECFEGLDGIGCESVIQLLHEKAETCGSIYVITHNDNLKQLFNRSVTVVKDNGKVTVVEQ